jgi:putative two-component system response regulator
VPVLNPLAIIDQFLSTLGWNPALSPDTTRAPAVDEDCVAKTVGRSHAGYAFASPAASACGPLVLVVDDQDSARQGLMKLLSQEGYRVTSATNGADAVDAVVREEPDLVLMDVMMPELDGFDACRQLKSQAATRLTPIVLITALQDSEDRIRGIEAGADDFLSKPINFHELKARVQSLVRIKRYTDELDSAAAVILSLSQTIEARDHYTVGHCLRLSRYATAVGTSLGLDEDDLSALARGGYLHDIGKVGVPDAVLLKRGRLTSAEFEQMKLHTVIGDHLCGELRSLRRVRPIVRSHHERLDGSGYPDGLRGDAIPLLAQIMSVVDVYDALTTERPYKPAWPPEVAFEELAREARRGWHPADLVDLLIDLGHRGELMTPRDADVAGAPGAPDLGSLQGFCLTLARM